MHFLSFRTFLRSRGLSKDFRNATVAVQILNSIRWKSNNSYRIVNSHLPLERCASTSHHFHTYPYRFHTIQSVAVSLGRPGSLLVNFYCTGKAVERSYVQDMKTYERLPKDAVPKHYKLNLTPNLKTFDFDGEVSIEVEVIKPTDKLILNSLDLTIKETNLQGQNTLIIPNKTELITEDEKLQFNFPEQLSPGKYNLNIKFTGILNDKMKGFYRSKYVNEKNEEVFAAVTQFEPTDARRCFPCWDEPAVKATFDITLKVPSKLVALSNMPLKNHSKAGCLEVYEFETTPIMSTYLVAVVVGEFDYIEDKSSDGVLVRVYTPPGKKEQGRFALEVATKVLPYYKDYFNIAYPLPKMDLIAIADFSAGAMENWGLITYRETALLVDEANTALARKQQVAITVSHEIAHQWFGNLVTMEWWTHLWLNEGYASFVEFLCVDHLFPHFDIWTQFAFDIYISGLELDCLKNSHPIEVAVNHPSEVDEIFDDISYSKGASIIRMLYHYLGDENFRKGMNLYLTKHQYKNTFTEDLWAALEEASKKPVGAIMSTWTKQMGFPVISVKQQRREDDNIVLSLHQQKFNADGSTDGEGYKWMIPISVVTSDNPTKVVASFVLSDKENQIVVPNSSNCDWVKINPGTIGFYRTKYPPEMLEKFIPSIKNKKIPPLDRLSLIDDLFALVQAGHTNTVEVLKFLSAFEIEDNYTVWCSIVNILAKLNVLLSYTDSEDDFVKFQKFLYSKIYKRLGWDVQPGESALNMMLRGLILGRMSLLDDENFMAEAKKRFDHHISSGPLLPADLRAASYRAILRGGYEGAFESLLKLYRSSDLREEKDRISRSLGAAKDVEVMKKVLQFSISDEVRSSDTIFVIISVAQTPVGRELAWQFFKDNYKNLIDRYQGGFLIARLVRCTAENFVTEEKAQEVEAFFKENKCLGAERSIQQALESIRLNAAWLKRDADEIKKYLKTIDNLYL